MTEKNSKRAKRSVAAATAVMLFVCCAYALKHNHKAEGAGSATPVVDINDAYTPLAPGLGGDVTDNSVSRAEEGQTLGQQQASVQAVTPAVTEDAVETEDPIQTEDPIETEDPTETEDPIQTEDPIEIEDPIQTEDPVETEDPIEIEDPVENQDPIEDEEQESDPVYGSSLEETLAKAAQAVEVMSGSANQSNDAYREALSAIMGNQALTLDDADLDSLKAHLALEGNQGVLSTETLYLHVYFAAGSEARTPVLYVSSESAIIDGNNNRWAALMVYADGSWYASVSRHSYNNSVTTQSLAGYYKLTMEGVRAELSDTSKWLKLGEQIPQESELDFAKRCIDQIIVNINDQSSATYEYFSTRVKSSLDSAGYNWAPLLNQTLASSVEGLSGTAYSYRIWKGAEGEGYNIFWTFEDVRGMSEGSVLSTVYKYNTVTGVLEIGSSVVTTKVVEGKTVNQISGSDFAV